jgi:hypothetical protein
MPIKQLDSDLLDWENIVWFLLGHRMRLSDVRTKGMEELRSEIGIYDPELTALTNSVVDMYDQKRQFHQEWERAGKKTLYNEDPKWKVLCKQLDRAVEAFKERICNTP